MISRIQAALGGEAEAQRKLIANRLERSLLELCSKCGVEPARVDAIAVTGNTTMLYLLAGTDTEPLSHSPFEITEYFGCLLYTSRCV